MAREEIVNEAIEIGGPSDVSLNHIATLVERRLGSSGKRRHLPVPAMKLLRPLVKPFSEVGSPHGLARALRRDSVDAFSPAGRHPQTGSG